MTMTFVILNNVARTVLLFEPATQYQTQVWQQVWGHNT